jgi:hypothetical protein
MASSEGTHPLKMNTREATLALIEAYKSLPAIWDTEKRRDNITADVASKQQPISIGSYPPQSHAQENTQN